jgi:hypothetical protein
MHKPLLMVCLFAHLLSTAQVYENFNDGNFTHDPAWTGTTDHFIVNADLQLQSAAKTASHSWLFTASQAIENAVWECHFKITYPTSASNFACMYLIADVPDPDVLNGYYVMVGGTADEISLFRQHKNQKVKIIDGVDKRIDDKIVDVRVRVTRDSLGVFRLYSRKADETDFFLEGEVQDQTLVESEWIGLSFTNTSTTGSSYFFDDIEVTGFKVSNPVLPVLTGELSFNELMVHEADGAAEYIEIYNRTDRLVHLTGICFASRRADGSISIGTRIPQGLLLEPRSYIAFTPDIARLRSHHEVPDTARIVECRWTTLNNSAATLLLMAADQQTVIDSVMYSNQMHHLLIHDKKGVALEKINPYLLSCERSSWHSAASINRHGSPGFKNSQYRNICNTWPHSVNSDVQIRLGQDWFSPDNDGVNDQCLIYYSSPIPGFVLRLTIFTPDGAVWTVLEPGRLLETEGFVSWDGHNRYGRISTPGIYIVLAEYYHPEQGISGKIKKPVLLTIR